MRLSIFSQDYNQKYATNNNDCFDTAGALMNKRQSQYKSWREALKLTAPRCTSKTNNPEHPKSIYEASFLTNIPYEKDIWGPPSYGKLVYDLYCEIVHVVEYLQEGRELCDEVMETERQIDADPQTKEELFWKQYQQEEEKHQAAIDAYRRHGFANINNPISREILNYSDINSYADNNFHVPTEDQFLDFVINDCALKLQGNNISSIENLLFGNNFEHIKLVRFAIEHMDELLLKNKDKFEKSDFLILLKWCKVQKSTLSHKDNEHKLYEYIKTCYKGKNKFYGWPSLFDLRKTLGNSEEDWKRPIAAMNKKIQNLKEKYDTMPEICTQN